MRGLAFLCLAAAATPPALAQQPNLVNLNGPDIVVTGPRLQDFRDRLAACLARACPTNEDADATLALAEALFLNGAYAEGRQVVHASLRRNRDDAAQFPEPVSDLYRAHSRFSRHLGFDRDGLASAHGVLNALEAGIPAEDHRHFTARLELSELQMMMGRYELGRREFGRLTREARAAGREDVVAIAHLRGLWYHYMMFRHDGVAKSELIRLSRDSDPARRMYALGARIVLARIYRSEGDEARANALLAEIGRNGAAHRRRLIHAPMYQLAQQEMRLEGDQNVDDAVRYGNTLARLTENYEDKWIDVGFWVLPDGHVSGIEIVRRGSATGWAEPLLHAIGDRTYTIGPEATYRLERYTFTGSYETGGPSRIRRRSPNARIEYLDLTIDGHTPPPPPSAPVGGMTQ